VVLPTYNCEESIERTIGSVIGQTYNNIELIIVDDASQDNTVQIIKAYQKNDLRIKLIVLSKNRGPGHARNLGTRKATGKYLTFIDHDDYQENNRYENMIKLMKKDQSQVCFSMAKEINIVTNKSKLLNSNPLPEGPINIPRDLPCLAYKYIPPWRKVYLLSFVRTKELVFAEGETKFDDVLFHSLLMLSLGSASMYPHCCYTHVRTGISISDTLSTDKKLRNDHAYSFSECLLHPIVKKKGRRHATKYYYKLLRRHLNHIDQKIYPLAYKVLMKHHRMIVVKEGIIRRVESFGLLKNRLK